MMTADEFAIIDALGGIERWSQQCHAASLHLVRSGIFGPDARVARGACVGVFGQHSWVVLGDPYVVTNTIIDVTAWSYDERRPGVWITDGLEAHTPHGAGSIFDAPPPVSGHGEEIALVEPEGGWSRTCDRWLTTFADIAGGPLDAQFWMRLFSHSPVGGWPAAEFVEAGWNTPGVRGLIPIDRVGMLTDINPDGLYR